MSQGQLLVLGSLKGTALAALEAARRETGYEATLMNRADDAIGKLDLPQLRALIVDLTTPGAARFCHEARARRALFNVPLIALSPKLSDLAFSNALRWGADDVVQLGALEPLRERLQAIPRVAAPLATATRGDAVIADPERGRCDVLGRVLANAGFNVKYATDPVATRFYLSKTQVRLFIMNADLGNPAPLINEARAAGNGADWIVTTKALNVEATREELRGLNKVVVMPAHGPPENVLFAVNLLQPAVDVQKRAEVRALYATVVLFRPVGVDRDECAFSYSVSANGLYLRTLLQPPSERLWLELNPPNVARRVKLLVEVAWARTFGQPGAETAPPGFGVRIVDGLGDDLSLWRQGFASLEPKAPSHQSLPEVRTSGSSFRVPLPARVPGRGAPGHSLPGHSLPGHSASHLPKGSLGPKPTLSVQPKLPDPPTLSSPKGRDATRAPSLSPSQVIVPDSTWQAYEGSPSPPPSVQLPRPPARSSQAVVLAALRNSLLPPSPAGSDAAPTDATDPLARDSSALHAAASRDDGLDRASNPRVLRTVLGLGDVQLEDTGRDQPTPAAPPPFALEVDLKSPFAGATAPLQPSASGADDSPEAATLVDLSISGAPLGPSPTLHDADSDVSETPSHDAITQVHPSNTPQSPVAPSVSPSVASDAMATARAFAATAANAPTTIDDVTRVDFSPAHASAGTARPVAAVATSPASYPTDPPHWFDEPSTIGSVSSLPPATQRRPRSKFHWSLALIAVGSLIAVAAFVIDYNTPAERALGSQSAIPSGTPLPRSHEPLAGTQQGEPVQPATPPASVQAAATEAAATEAAATEAAGDTPPSPSVVPSPEASQRALPTSERTEHISPDPHPLPEAPDASKLPEDSAYLLVRSEVDANVFVHGVVMGKTNQWLESRCGFRFLRLGTVPGQWLSEGKPVKLRCQKPNEVELAPYPR